MAISLSALGVNIDRLYHGQPPVAGATLYTAPGSATARTQVTTAVIANPSPTAIAVRLGLIPSGGSNDGTHYLVGDQSIPGNSSLLLELAQPMRPGDALHGTSGTLPAPTGVTAAAATTGGTLAASAYYYKMTGTNANGETVGSSEVTVTTTGSTSSVTLSWTRLLGVTGYKVYRSATTGTEVLLATVPSGATTSYVDTGLVTTSGNPPTTGSAAGCIFTINGAELPA